MTSTQPHHPVANEHNARQDGPDSMVDTLIEPGAGVLVTGASGLLGYEVAYGLIRAGYRVRTLHRSATSVDGAEHIRGSITDPETVDIAMEGLDVVVHMAAKVSFTGARADFEHINVHGTEVIFNAAQRAGINNVLYVSSPSVAHAGSSLIGVDAQEPDPEHTEGHYAQTKAEAELIARTFASDGMNVAILRPHIVWGPGDTQLTERVIDRARSGRLPLLGNGAALVDTLYIDNAVDALVSAVHRLPMIAGETLVVTNGEPRPIGELIASFAVAAGAPVPGYSVPASVAKFAGWTIQNLWLLAQRCTSKDLDEPPMTKFLAEQLSTAHWFDQRRTQELLQWQPAVTMTEGFQKLSQHIQDHGSAAARPPRSSR